VGQDLDVDQHVAGPGQDHGVTRNGSVVPEAPADLRQASPQRAQGIVGLPEE
jgi:hypothetical protein